MSNSTLFPGYHQVESFASDDEYEAHEGGVEEDVEYVTLDLGLVEPTLVPSTSAYRLIGLDTPTPLLQLSGTIFKGQHQNLLGTELIFAEANNSERNGRSLVPFATAERRIKFKEVELREKKATEPEQAPSEQKKDTKKRNHQTTEQLVGNAVSVAPAAHAKRSNKKSKDKGKQREEAQEGAEAVQAGLTDKPEDGTTYMDTTPG